MFNCDAHDLPIVNEHGCEECARAYRERNRRLAGYHAGLLDDPYDVEIDDDYIDPSTEE